MPTKAATEGLTAAEALAVQMNKMEAADKRRAEIEAERKRYLAERAEQKRQEFEKAKLARAKEAADRQKQKEEELEALKVKWATANKHVEDLRMESYKQAAENVTKWKDRHAKASDNCDKADTSHKTKMATAWKTKSERYEAWVEKTAAERRKQAAIVAQTRTQSREKFSNLLGERDDRLAEAQARAEARRLKIAEEKAERLAERERLAEAREEEAWLARLRVIEESKERIARVDAEVKRKAEQAKVCLEKRTENVAAVKLERRVWSAGVARVLTSYVGE